MEYSEKEYISLWGVLNSGLREKTRNIVFLELKCDICHNGEIIIPKDIPLPIQSSSLVEGIKNNDYYESIEPQKFLYPMIYLIICDEDFRFNQNYIDIIRKLGPEVRNIVQSGASRLSCEGNHLDALIYYKASAKIFGSNIDTLYNIANSLRELASGAEKSGSTQKFDVYYKLSFMEFYRLSADYPDFFGAHYHLGFYYLVDMEQENALKEWEQALTVTSDDSVKEDIIRLVDSLKDNITFENGKRMVMEDNLTAGIELLAPLVEKHETWSEAKYYLALGLRKRGSIKRAKAYLTELVVSGESFPEIFNELGLCCFSQGMHDKAVEYFKKAHLAKTDEPGYLCNLGMAYYETGQNNEAKKCIEEAYKLNTDDELTKKCKVWSDAFCQY